ncbi:hypothetical protein BAE44_0006263 [Dichanthelium oligosanthes]|uniref:Aminotransferase class I/classII large domain-containing protein n=1 Tax=Dichanthelium oligosanthes TaxID=888268 RepID=A0A1E5W647_9POAL|nr:hypothetical protein BAE44_0006263 [Dichanthelium oligosanthes]
MELRLSAASRRSAPSPIQQLSHLAQRVGAVNLAEGFPDFPAPPHVKAAAAAAIAADLNQYRHVQGICDILAKTMERDHGLDVDPLTDFVICCGQSEAFAAAIFAIIDQGDEVVLFDPAYETYETCIELARGVPIHFVTNLINDAGVAAVPGRGFFHRNFDGESYHHRYVRFAFCKGDDTLMAAALRMRKLADGKGTLLSGSGKQDQTASP